MAAAAEEVGEAAFRAAGHRVEHLELVPDQAAATLGRLGVVASVQPAFDALWGGDRGLYTDRLGAPRSLASNPFARLAAAGMPLAFGSDAPVTPLAPWEGVRAAVHHHAPGSRVDAATAFAAHTAGGWAAAHRPGRHAHPGRTGAPGSLGRGGVPGPDRAATPVPAHGREWTDDLGGVMTGKLDLDPRVVA